MFNSKNPSPEYIKLTEIPLSDILSYHGYNNTDITHMILTHLHFDHSGGATMIDSNGNCIPAFPNAKYYLLIKL